MVGSPRVLDACGVCGGDNSTCQIISGLFTEAHLREGYRLVVQIPAGACSILIEELVPTSNYLGTSGPAAARSQSQRLGNDGCAVVLETI